MLSKLGHHNVGQQARRLDAFVDDMRRYRRMDQCFALFADPFPTDNDSKHAGELSFSLAFTDALEDEKAALVMAVVRFVMDQRTRKLLWQRHTLGLLAHFGPKPASVAAPQVRLR